MYLFNVIEWANGEIILEMAHLSNFITSILLDEYCYRVSAQDITYVYWRDNGGGGGGGGMQVFDIRCVSINLLVCFIL